MANYIVCLAHFCELHGPSTIICTQVVKPSIQDKHILAPNSKVQTCASCELYIPDGSANIITKDSLHSSNKGNGPQMVFISNHYPSSQDRYTALTKLVMKSLSVETSSDISKPMFFGDAINGYCINKIFTIKDINARGSERKYALIVISDSETDILSNWDIVGLYFNEVINLIQERVTKTMEEISAQKISGNGNTVTGLLDNEKYLRRSMIKPKSLKELTDDDHIFVKFHLWAIELLKDILR
ncbi:protein required for amino acid permease transport from the Golgi to the cell surface [Scheffersomyces coipomensis]|uniref:protein required for amino acid permease transport from the Golgi to the cell surface n=1 Tax=Scheffersomyces coipomensis TaxID=1788519 RepID=UPI00315CC1BE